MGSQEKEDPHYNFESDNEPPTDEVGDKITIIKKLQVTKEIIEVSYSEHICRLEKALESQEDLTK
jgi:hypothetical protein